jgi:hypothetical protein
VKRGGFTPVPLVVIGIVLLAAALIVVGYGVPVGVGLFVGLALGCGVGVVGVLWLGAGPGRTVGSGGLTFFGTDNVTSGPPQFPEWFQDGALAAAVEMTALHRVVAVGQVTEIAAIRVELIALELRERGGVAIAVAHTEPPDGRSLGPFARISVLDDVGTSYAAGSDTHGGSPFATRLSIRFAPAPPEAAGELTIRVEEFVNPFPGPARRQVVGPWVFVVPLGPAPASLRPSDPSGPAQAEGDEVEDVGTTP